jgi:hypothetical protein
LTVIDDRYLDDDVEDIKFDVILKYRPSPEGEG